MTSSAGPSGDQTEAGSGHSQATISIQNFAFAPETLSVAPGVTIAVVNKDSSTHTLTSTSGSFSTGDVSGGQSVQFRAPTKPGSYPYRCDIHQYMTGTLIVT